MLKSYIGGFAPLITFRSSTPAMIGPEDAIAFRLPISPLALGSKAGPVSNSEWHSNSVLARVVVR